MARDARKNNPDTPAEGSVSVIVVAWQSGEDLTRCLSALTAQTRPPLEILLVDNASTDGAPQAAVRAISGITLISAGANLGFAAGVNLGARRARGDWLALVNPDAFAAP
ncbi:MAG: glycosyltransferase, partial [Phenylobacterium sp.]|nr:glycosyltransferase [Phenylobacterium sp.]